MRDVQNILKVDYDKYYMDVYTRWYLFLQQTMQCLYIQQILIMHKYIQLIAKQTPLILLKFLRHINAREELFITQKTVFYYG